MQRTSEYKNGCPDQESIAGNINYLTYKLSRIALMLLALLSTNTAFAKNNYRIFALQRYGELFCAVELRKNFSIPVCRSADFFENSLTNRTFIEKQYLSECPDSWIEQNICVLKIIRARKTRANPFTTLYNDLIKHPVQQVFYFVHHSLDDLLEDFFALGLPAAAGLTTYSSGSGAGYTLLTVLLVHTLSSPLGDAAGDWIQQYQPGAEGEKEIEWHLPEIIANKIEDGIKAVFIVISYGNTLIIKVLERRYSRQQIIGTDSSPQVSTLYNLVISLLFTYDTYQFLERYNWINEIADAIADMFTELFH